MSLLSCDRVDEKFLFDEDDPEYDLARQLQLNECISTNAIFGEMDELEEFDESPYAVGDVFKIVQDSSLNTTIYVLVQSISATEMTLAYSSDTERYNKIVTFQESDHADIVSFFEQASCDTDYESFFTATGLNSTAEMSFSWDLETIITADDEDDDEDDDDDDPEEYRYVTLDMKVDLDYPLFFYFYNGKKSQDFVTTAGNDEQTLESNITITLLEDDDDCTSDLCDFDSLDLTDTDKFPPCDLEVDTDAIEARLYNTNMLSLSSTDCQFLDSAEIDY
ncbi:MAG: hypothetical protein CME65_14480 [Halobacteriovoraceae bacterium]|nr:hypothetical protein [Halobacteriovoraceae bacterium]|tara:strand:- start:33166 stop:33999 length:834 start_codon:yes stop_codon:yes gene_type:complete